MPDPDLNRFLPDWEPPQFASAAGIVADALRSLEPPQRIDVPTWAERDRRLSTPNYTGPWRNDFAPYMTEPARMLTSRKYGAVVFVAPARTAKTESLIQNAIGHRVVCNPRNVLVVCATRDAAREFSIQKIGGLIRHSPNVRERIAGKDNTFDKSFRGNMRLRIGWPVISQLSMLDIPDVFLTDYDRMVDDVDGEGSAFDLGRKRTQSFHSLGMTVAESSPGRPVTDPDWTPETPHEAPPTTGILALYNRGTRGQFYWVCPHCHEPFRPVMDRLQWDQDKPMGAAAKSAEMICLHCGGCIGPDRKDELNTAGMWLHETDDGTLVRVDDAAIRDTDIVSYWCEGPVAAMQSWEQLVLRELQARHEFETTGDETTLKSTVTLDQGRPFVSSALDLGDGLNADMLKGMAKPMPLGVAPAETRFVTIQVDVQGNRFVVQWEARGVGLETWLIGRTELSTPPEGAPDQQTSRAIDPGRYSEDWAALFPLLEQPIPVAETGMSLVPRALCIDMHGSPGVTSNAYRFYREVKRRGLGGRVFLSRGVGGQQRRDRAALREPEKENQKRGYRNRRSDIRYIELSTDDLKDEVALAVTRKVPGPGAYHISDGMPDRVFAELAAEVRTDKGWERRKPGLPNEAFDLAVMGRGLAIVLKAERVDWDAPPPWAAPVEQNSFAVTVDAAPERKPAPVAPVRRRRGIRGQRISKR